MRVTGARKKSRWRCELIAGPKNADFGVCSKSAAIRSTPDVGAQVGEAVIGRLRRQVVPNGVDPADGVLAPHSLVLIDTFFPYIPTSLLGTQQKAHVAAGRRGPVFTQGVTNWVTGAMVG